MYMFNLLTKVTSAMVIIVRTVVVVSLITATVGNPSNRLVLPETFQPVFRAAKMLLS